MDQADDIFMQVLTEMRRQLAIVRTLVRALPRILRRRSALENWRNTAQQNPVIDRNQNPDPAARWSANERETRRLAAENTRLAAENAGRLQALEGRQAELQALNAEIAGRVAQDPELAAQVARLSPAEQDLVNSAVAGNIQAELHGDEQVRRPDGSLMTRNEELQSLTADVRTQVAQNPEFAAQVGQLSQAEQDLVYRQAALGVQQELDRRFPDSRDPNHLSAEALDRQAEENLDLDHDREPDDLENRHETQDAAQQRAEQDQQYQQYVDPDGNGIDNAVEDREAERALRDREAAQQNDQRLRQDRAEQESTERGAETAAAAAGATAAVGEAGERAENLDEPETDQAQQRQQEGLDGADPGQVQGARGPEVGQDGQSVGRDGSSESVVGGRQQPGQDQQGASTDQSGPRTVNIGSMNGGAFAVGSNARATVNFHGPGQGQSGADQPGVDQPDGPGQQGQRPDPLESQLAQAREENDRGRVPGADGEGTVRLGSVTGGTVNGVRLDGQSLPEGRFTAQEDGSVTFQGANDEQATMSFGPNAEINGQPVSEIARLQAQQTASPPAGSKRPEGMTAAEPATRGGQTPGAQHAQTVNKGGGRGAEGGGREPKGG